MLGENMCILIGNAGQDAEYKPLNNSAVANINLGIDDSYIDKQSGQRVDRTQWLRIVAYGNWAEYAQKHIKKGAKLYVKGKLNNRSWTDKQTGQKRYAVEIVADKLEKLDWEKKSGQQGGYQQTGQQGGYQKPAQPQGNNGYQFQQPQAPQQQPQQPQQGGYAQQQQPQPQPQPQQGYTQQGGAETPDEAPDDIPF